MVENNGDSIRETRDSRCSEVLEHIEKNYPSEAEQHEILVRLAAQLGYVVLKGYDFECLGETGTDKDYRVIVRRMEDE